MNIKNYSRKREAILSKVKSTACHPAAEWVYRKLKGEYPDLSLGTVYRNLSLFKEEGIITSVGDVEGQERFDGDIKPHAHFICQKCRAVADIALPSNQAEITAYLEQNRSVSVERVSVSVYGICALCLEAKSSALSK